MRTFQPKKWSLIKFLLILKIFLSERQLYVQFLVELRGDILRNFHESLSFIATFVKIYSNEQLHNPASKSRTDLHP